MFAWAAVDVVELPDFTFQDAFASGDFIGMGDIPLYLRGPISRSEPLLNFADTRSFILSIF